MPPTDQDYMRRALELAALGLGHTAPNPAVGAVVVRDGEIVGEGYHHAAGEPHAEVEALRAAGPAARGATVYVTLEPCSHHGRTPPCTSALLDAGVSRVVYACADCDPRTAGRADRILQASGVTVSSGVLADKARRLNRAYFKHKTTGLPFLTLKQALTLDARVATRTGASQWITGSAARERVHQMRARSDAVLVGLGTVLADDPRLTARRGEELLPSQPLRLVLDPRAQTPPTARLLSAPGPTLLAVGESAPPDRLSRLRDAGADLLPLPLLRGHLSLATLFEELSRRPIMSVLAEAGPRLAGALLDQGWVDELVLFYAPLLLADNQALPAADGRSPAELTAALRFRLDSYELVGEDLMVVAYPCSPD